MKIIAQIKLQETPEQAVLLRQTLERANAACNDLSDLAWREQKFRNYDLHYLAYHRIKSDYDLAAQVVIRCLAKVGDAYKLDQKAQRVFRPHGSIAFDDRILSFQIEQHTVSIWTIGGRQRMTYLAGERQHQLLQTRQGESDLVYRRGGFYLLVTCTVDEPTPDEVEHVLGVDLGIVNIASDSDGNVASGDRIEHRRSWYARRRAGLQSRRTKSARRRLKHLGGRQHRFQSDTNHCISKMLVARAKSTGRGLALENLKGIRDRVKVGHTQRARHHNWAFRQLRDFMVYKAAMTGVPVVLVDPRNTSRSCNVCGHCDKANRKIQALFCCVSCGHSAPADTNAAKNIRDWAVINQPMVSDLRIQGQTHPL